MSVAKVSPSWTDFKGGSELYPLTDDISLTVTEELNGLYDLEIEYPDDGEFADYLIAADATNNYSAVISAPPRAGMQYEPFIVFDVIRTGEKVRKIKAHNAAYRTNKTVIPPFTATGITATLAALNVTEFLLININLNDESTQFENEKPTSLWELVGAVAKKFKAELTYTYNYANTTMRIEYRTQRGVQNDDITIREGVNIVSIEEETNCEDRITSVYGYAQGDDGNGNLTTVTAEVNTGLTGDGKPLIVDFTGEFEGLPTYAQLLAKVTAYTTELTATLAVYGRYTVSANFIPLGNTTEYAGNPVTCDVGDTVTINALNKYIKARIVKTVFNPHTEKYDLISVGSEPVNVADTIAELERNQAGYYNGKVVYE